MIDREHDLALTRQAKILKLSRSSLYYRPRPVPPELSPNLGDGLRDQAAAVWDCEDAGLAATSIPSVNLTP